jgi:antitoxin (DNA-binding transcriptional repressor) of toxin-antitoxin stability system
MSIYLQDVSGDCSKAVEEMKTGKHVILTKEGIPVAVQEWKWKSKLARSTVA